MSNINLVSFFGILVVLPYLLISPHRIGAHSFRPNVDLPQVNLPVEIPDLDIQDRAKRGSPQVVYFWETRVQGLSTFAMHWMPYA